MLYINSPLNQIILYVGDNNRKAKQTLAYGKSHGLPISLINLQKIPITGTHILELIEMLSMSPSQLANTDSPLYNEKVGDQRDFDHEDWLKLFSKHPQLMRNPIAIKGGNALLIETPSDILKLS